MIFLGPGRSWSTFSAICEEGDYAERLFGCAWAREVLPQAHELLLARGLGTSTCVLACVSAGGRADETPEVPVQLALIVEPDTRRDFARLHARHEELLRAHDAQPGEVSVRG